MSRKWPGLSTENGRLLDKLLSISDKEPLKVSMAPGELARLIALVASNIGRAADMQQHYPRLWQLAAVADDYYSVKPEWFAADVPQVSGPEVMAFLATAQTFPGFQTFFDCLSMLHKKRRKFALITQRQPVPTMVQVSPRALIEYHADVPTEYIASWLSWRKFLYDLDNRSAQECGYLFEPILRAAIGGTKSAPAGRVVRRRGDATKSRQVDCWKQLPNGTVLAYELKMRITIAASGQGRFAEELSFPGDCVASGITPVLVVFDPTMNDKLRQIVEAYRAAGGQAFVGQAAWEHLEQQAGAPVDRFIERYVRRPIDQVSAFEQEVNGDPGRRAVVLQDLETKLEGQMLSVRLGRNTQRIERYEDARLADGEGGEDE